MAQYDQLIAALTTGRGTRFPKVMPTKLAPTGILPTPEWRLNSQNRCYNPEQKFVTSFY